MWHSPQNTFIGCTQDINRKMSLTFIFLEPRPHYHWKKSQVRFMHFLCRGYVACRCIPHCTMLYRVSRFCTHLAICIQCFLQGFKENRVPLWLREFLQWTLFQWYSFDYFGYRNHVEIYCWFGANWFGKWYLTLKIGMMREAHLNYGHGFPKKICYAFPCKVRTDQGWGILTTWDNRKTLNNALFATYNPSRISLQNRTRGLGWNT